MELELPVVERTFPNVHFRAFYFGLTLPPDHHIRFRIERQQKHLLSYPVASSTPDISHLQKRTYRV